MSTVSRVKVSVIIPAYNSAGFIRDTLESVFAQTYTDYEVLVINDGSSDTPDLEVALAPYRDRIIYLQREHGGPGAARNTGMRHARGEVLAFLDSDDLWFPDHLKRQMAFLEAHPALDLVYADVLQFGESSYAGLTYMQTAPSKGPVNLEALLADDCSVATSSTVVRKEAVLAVGLFDETLIISEDFDLWLRLALHGFRLGYQREVLAAHRLRPASLTMTHGPMCVGTLTVLRRLAGSNIQLSHSARRILYQRIAHCEAQNELLRARSALLRGDYAEARAAFDRANVYFGKSSLRFAVLGLRFSPGFTKAMYRLSGSMLRMRLKLARLRNSSVGLVRRFEVPS